MAIDLACIEDLTIQEVANRIGASLSSVKKFYKAHHDEIETARASIVVSDQVLLKVLDFWGDGLSQPDIAEAAGLSCDVVRRLILIAEIDEEPEDHGAADSLAALQAAHPDKFYEEDVRALTEYSGWRRPTFLLAADCVMPLAEETARYRIDQMPERGVSLAGVA